MPTTNSNYEYFSYHLLTYIPHSKVERSLKAKKRHSEDFQPNARNDFSFLLPKWLKVQSKGLTWTQVHLNVYNEVKWHSPMTIWNLFYFIPSSQALIVRKHQFCLHRCRYCPNCIYGSNWIETNLSLEKRVKFKYIFHGFAFAVCRWSKTYHAYGTGVSFNSIAASCVR